MLKACLVYGHPYERNVVPTYDAQWSGVHSYIGHIWHYVLDQSKEALNIVQTAWFMPVADFGHLVLVCMDALVIN